MPWETSAGPCSNDPVDTSSEHPHCLASPLAGDQMLERLDTCLSSRIAPNIRWLALGSGSCCSADGAAIQAVARPSHASNLVRGPVCRRVWHSRTVAENIRMSNEQHLDSRCSSTHIFLLFMHVTNLKPDIFFVQRPWRIMDDISEALHIILSVLYRQSLSAWTTNL